MFGGNRKTVSWKGDETAGAGAGGIEEVLEYQVEDGNSTMRKVEEEKRRKKLEREEERQRKQEQFEEQWAKLKKWKQGIPEKKPDVTDDVFMYDGFPGLPSLHYFPLRMTKEQEANVQMAKEKGRHTFGSPNLLFIQSKGRFVHYQK